MTDAAAFDCEVDPRDPGFYRDPYPVYADWHRRGGVLRWAAYDGLLCFAGHARVDALLRDRRFGRQITHRHTRESLGWPPRPAHLQHFDAVESLSLLNLEGEAHRALRKRAGRAFLNRQLLALRPLVDATIDEALNALAARDARGEAIDLLGDYATPIPARVIAAMIGAPAERVPELLDWSHAMCRVYTGTQTLAEERAADRAAAAFAAMMREQIAERRAAPRDDLLSQLMRDGADGEALDEQALISTAVLLLNAGHEASVHAAGNAVKRIAQSGLAPQALFASEAQALNTVEEALRVDPPLHLFKRYALEAVEIAGQRLAPGDEIGLLLGAANHDPAVHPDPARFDPHRRDIRQLAFGAGPHFCIGAPLARLELSRSLGALFQRFPGLQIIGAAPVADSYHFRGLQALPVRLR